MHTEAAIARPSRVPLVATLALLLAGAVLTTAAQAQVYKYTDANGQVHYTDRAPSNATQVKGPTPPASTAQPAPAPAPAAPTSPDAQPPPLPVSTQQAQQVERDVAAARAESCKKAKENYDKAVRAQRVYRTNDKGEREFVSPAEADALRLQMKAEMDGACG
jgi:hypothetical protein